MCANESLQVSLHRSMDAKTHLTIGKALAPLREQGVLIIGSGAIIHDFNATETNTNFVNAVDHAITMIPPSERFPPSPLSFPNPFS